MPGSVGTDFFEWKKLTPEKCDERAVAVVVDAAAAGSNAVPGEAVSAAVSWALVERSRRSSPSPRPRVERQRGTGLFVFV